MAFVNRTSFDRLEVEEMQVKQRRQALGMEGAMARWYARNRSSERQMEGYRKHASELTDGLPSGADVLEVAPGPGYLAIEMARLGLRVSAVDISRTFVQIGNENAREAGVSIDFRQGDAAVMPFEAESFDLIVCQAAFKNFVHPASALDEMHRVLRSGGTAVIQDMSSDASHADIEEEVRKMQLGWWSSFTTKATLEMLRRRAYSPARFQGLAAESSFKTCEIKKDGIGLDVRLRKAI
jgi:ubiquinone/menaquinone biosynthesis C-methylase UbiE